MKIKTILTPLILFSLFSTPSPLMADSLDEMAKSIAENNGSYKSELAKAEADIMDEKASKILKSQCLMPGAQRESATNSGLK